MHLEAEQEQTTGDVALQHCSTVALSHCFSASAGQDLRRHDVGMSLSGPLLAELDAAAALTNVADAIFVTVRGGLEVGLG